MTIERQPNANANVIGIADAKLLRRTLGAFATGVTVVTVGGDSPHGMTANSFTSVSLDPPLIAVNVDRRAVMHELLFAHETFGVSVLASHQEPAARHFADRWRPQGWAQFDSVDWHRGPQTGVPLLSGALATFECELWRSYDGGDHTIFVGNLVSADRAADSSPESDALLFVHGKFRRLARQQAEPGELAA